MIIKGSLLKTLSLLIIVLMASVLTKRMRKHEPLNPDEKRYKQHCSDPSYEPDCPDPSHEPDCPDPSYEPDCPEPSPEPEPSPSPEPSPEPEPSPSPEPEPEPIILLYNDIVRQLNINLAYLDVHLDSLIFEEIEEEYLRTPLMFDQSGKVITTESYDEEPIAAKCDTVYFNLITTTFNADKEIAIQKNTEASNSILQYVTSKGIIFEKIETGEQIVEAITLELCFTYWRVQNTVLLKNYLGDSSDLDNIIEAFDLWIKTMETVLDGVNRARNIWYGNSDRRQKELYEFYLPLIIRRNINKIYTNYKLPNNIAPIIGIKNDTPTAQFTFRQVVAGSVDEVLFDETLKREIELFLEFYIEYGVVLFPQRA